MALATLSIDLVAQLASLQQGLDKAGRLAEQQAAKIESTFNGLKGAAAGIGTALAGALSVAGLAGFFRATVDGLDRLNDLRDATGASIENLSALEDIAARTGTSLTTVSDAVVKLNKFLGDASKPGRAAANALQAIGLSAAELKKQDPAEALRQVAVALAGYADDGNKARIVQELFGKSIQQVAPLLGDLAKAGELNATVTTQQAQEAEKFNQQLAVLKKNAVDVARDIAGPLVKSLNDFFAAINRANQNPAGFFGGVAEQLNTDFIRARLQAKQEEIERLAPDAERARGILVSQPDSVRAKATLADYAELQQAAQDYRKELDKILYDGKGRRPANEGGGKFLAPSLPDLPTGKPTAVASPRERALVTSGLTPAALEALKALEQTDAAKIAALSAALDELFAIRAGGAGTGPEVDAAIEKLRDDLEKLNPAAQAAAAAKKQLNDILEQTPSAQLGAVLLDIDRLNQAFTEGKITVELWAEAVKVSVGRLPKEAEEPLEKLDELTRQAASNIQDALGDTVLATLDGKFESIEKLWGNMLKRLVAQAVAAQLGKSLLGEDFGKTGQLGGAAGSFIDFLKGMGGGARAGGGPVVAGRPYLVGEKRAEVFVPDRNGTVMPDARALGAAAGGNSFSVNVQGDASENTVRLINGALAQFEARMMRRGG
jgi:hypothetical protein